MFILHSTNSRASFVLAKNPASGLVTQSLKQGILAGWYPPGTDTTWCATFLDSPTGSSFGVLSPESGNFLDFYRYAAPVVFSQIIRGFLDHLLSVKTAKKFESDDVEAAQTVELPMVYLPKFRPEIYVTLCRGMNLDMTCEEILLDNARQTGLYNIKVQSQSTLRDLVRKLYLLVLCWDKSIQYTHVVIEEDRIKKVADVISLVDPPYYLRKHLLLRLVGVAPKMVKKYKASFEAKGMLLTPGTNALVRDQFVMDQLKKEDSSACTTLVDVGCGDKPSQQRRRWHKDLDGWRYIAIDSDPDVMQKLQKLTKFGDVVLCESIDEAEPLVLEQPLEADAKHRECAVVATEIVEHLPKDQVVKTLVRLLQWQPVKLLVTTPNADFNKHYHMTSSSMRHPDHLHEYTREEWLTTAEAVCQEMPGWKYEYVAVGDQIDGCCNIHGTVFSRV